MLDPVRAPRAVKLNQKWAGPYIMNDVLDQRLIPSDLALESRMGDETVLLHLENSKYYGLDAMGTQIWELIKEGSRPHAICVLVAERYDIDLERAKADVRVFLADLKAHDILVDA